MALPEALIEKNREELEEWFLAGIDDETRPVEQMLAVLAHIVDSGDLEQADGWAELLQDSLAERSDSVAALALLELRCEWHGTEPGFRTECAKIARAAFSSRQDKVLVENAGFDKNVPLPEVLQRLRVLRNLVPGALSHDNTWGFGIIRRVDDFYARVTIDFDTKPGHEMSLAYAAEALDLVGPDHLLARKHSDSEALEQLVQNDPAEVARIALRSFGPLNAGELQERLVPGILPDSAWKKFWDQARKVLKADPLVEIPSKRNDPVRLISTPKDRRKEWYTSFEKECDPSSILNMISELESNTDISGLDDSRRSILADRLAFAIWGSEGKRPDVTAMALLTADRLGLDGDHRKLGSREIDLQAVTRGLLAPDILLGVLSMLPARSIGDFLAYMSEQSGDILDESLLLLLPRLPLSALSEVVNRFKEIGRENNLANRYEELFEDRKAGVVMLLWLSKNLEKGEEWGFVRDFDLLLQGMEALEKSCVGERLRSRNQLRALFEQSRWLAERMAGLSESQREAVLRRIMGCRGWDEVGRRSVIGGIVKAYPELQSLLVGDDAEEDARPTRGRATSWRSFRERQERLRKLVEEDIPENSREIGVARSYGDLRENAEYQAAKDHQKILHKRRSEMENDLGSVRGSDFADCFTDAAGMGTIVTISRPGGTTQQFCILGEWDRDEALAIISSESRLAKLLTGHKAGEEIMLPSEVGEELCTITRVEGLTDEIKEWARG